MTEFKLNPALDTDSLARRFSDIGRLHIPDFLRAQDADRLRRALSSSRGWWLVMNQGEKVFDIDPESRQRLSPQQIVLLDKAVADGARTGFQFRFENIRVPDSAAARSADPSPLSRFAEFMSSEPVLTLMRRITGDPEIAFADAQATAYGAGHLLTAHDDNVAGKNRRAAWVYNLTRDWSVEWGGLLMFHGADGHVAEGWVPRFNALNLFRVPQRHSVSQVASFAPVRRISVTGWLRAEPQPS